MKPLPALLALATSALLTADAQDSAAPPLNVVVLVADDLGWRDLGCTGSTFYETPNLDRLAAQGTRFANGYASCPVCSPTRVALLTGKHPARLDTTDWFGARRAEKLLPAPYVDHLPLEEVTLAEALRAAGYATGFFGKWHLGGPGFYPEDQGFDVNVGGFERGHPPQGYFSPYGNPKLPDGPAGECLTDRLTDEALRFVDAHAEEPFFVYLCYYEVHTPLQTKPELRAKYERKRDALPAVDGPRFLPEGEREARQVQDHAVYAGMLETTDTSVGRVLARLDELELADRTLVVFTSDNGGLSTSEGSPTSNVPLRGGKGWLYEGGVRVPWIVRLPGAVPAARVVDAPITSCDLYPTVLELLGLPRNPAQHADGVSLAPLLSGGPAPDARPLFWHYPHYGNQGGFPGSALRLGRWKLCERFEDGTRELYDLAVDPGERHDLAAIEPERAAELAQLLGAWRTKVDAKLPRPNPDWKR